MRGTRHPTERIAPPWLWPNLVGLDAPLVAVSWQWLFARAFEIDLPGVIHVILALSAWCVYLADRLLDVVRSEVCDHATDRHRFTRRHSRKLLAILTIAAAVDLVLILSFAPRNLVITGISTAVLLALYYLVRLRDPGRIVAMVPREVLCGMVFALGSTIGPHAFATQSMDETTYFVPVVFFGLLCSASCILISVWEREADLAVKDASAFTSHSRLIPHLSVALTALAIVSVILGFFLSLEIFLSISLAALALRITLHFEQHLSRPMLRALADGLLLTPLVFLIL